MDFVVRSVEELKTLDELHLSKKALQTCRYMPIDSLVSTARHHYHCTPKNSDRHDWLEEVKEALNLHGFIRHDFDPESFAMGRLYQAVSHAYADASFVSDFYDLMSNERYEKYRNLTKGEKDAVFKALDNNLTGIEPEVIKLFYGLKPGLLPMAAEEIALELNTTKAEVRTAYKSALKKLWRPGTLPRISQFTTE